MNFLKGRFMSKTDTELEEKIQGVKDLFKNFKYRVLDNIIYTMDKEISIDNATYYRDGANQKASDIFEENSGVFELMKPLKEIDKAAYRELMKSKDQYINITRYKKDLNVTFAGYQQYLIQNIADGLKKIEDEGQTESPRYQKLCIIANKLYNLSALLPEHNLKSFMRGTKYGSILNGHYNLESKKFQKKFEKVKAKAKKYEAKLSKESKEYADRGFEEAGDAEYHKTSELILRRKSPQKAFKEASKLGLLIKGAFRHAGKKISIAKSNLFSGKSKNKPSIG